MKKVPQHIILNDPQPRESAVMQKRSYPAVLRFNKVKHGDDPKKFMLHKLMLYRPTRKEIELSEVQEMYDETYKGKRKVDIVKNQVMEHLEGVEEARYYVDQVKKELDISETAIALDAAKEQDNADCEEEGTEEHAEFLHIDPGQIATDSDKHTSGIYKKIDIPGADELRASTRTLDSHQREVVNIGVKYAKDVVKSRREGNLAPVPPLLMVHGCEGAGKSTVIKVLAQRTQTILQR